MPFLETIRRHIQQHRLISPGQTVVVGVSGGADSLALMVALYQLRQTFEINLHVATLDHGWRGEQGAVDVRFVLAEASKRQIPTTANTLQAPSISEAAGRKARYNFFARVAQSIGAKIVAVGHHADDQAETVLMRILRGSGLHGLQGMGWQAPMPYHSHLTLIRPLLGVTREEVEAFCARQGLAPRHDPTNNDTRFLRNQIRSEVLPHLAQINTNVATGLVRLADTASVESDFIEQHTQAALEIHARKRGGQWLFGRQPFRELHPALQRRVLSELCWRTSRAPQFDITYGHIIDAQRIAINGEQGAVSQFINGVQMRVEYETLVFEKQGDQPRLELSLLPEQQITLRIGEPIALDRGAIVLSPGQPPANYKPFATLHLPEDAQLSLRTRRPGDRIALPGMNEKTQKIKDWMINRKIPRLYRANIPLIIEGTAIAMILYIPDSLVAFPYSLPSDNTQPMTLARKV